MKNMWILIYDEKGKFTWMNKGNNKKEYNKKQRASHVDRAQRKAPSRAATRLLKIQMNFQESMEKE